MGGRGGREIGGRGGREMGGRGGKRAREEETGEGKGEQT